MPTCPFHAASPFGTATLFSTKIFSSQVVFSQWAILIPPKKYQTLFLVDKKEEEHDKPKLDFSLVMTEKTLADQEAEKQTQIGADPQEGQASTAAEVCTNGTLLIGGSYGTFTLTERDSDTDLDSDCKPDGYFVLYRTFHIAQTRTLIPIPYFCTDRVRVQSRVHLRQCK